MANAKKEDRMFNPSDYKDDVTEEKQKSDNIYTPPPSGLNVSVNVGLQRNMFSSKNPDENGRFTHYQKITITTKIVESVRPKNKKDAKAAKAAEGKTFSWDIWSDFSKPSNANRLAALCLACGVEEAFDPDDDRALCAAICGVPYGTEHELSTRNYKDRDGNAKTSNEFKVTVIKPLKDAAKRKEIMNDPDFSKEYAAEFREARDNRKTDGQGSGEGHNGGGGDEGFYDEDLPF